MLDDKGFSRHLDEFNYKFDKLVRRIGESMSLEIQGKIVKILGNTIIAGCRDARLGMLYKLVDGHGELDILAEIIAIDGVTVKLMAYNLLEGISQDAYIKEFAKKFTIHVGEPLLGKVINGLGRIIGRLDKKPHKHNSEDELTEEYEIGAAAPEALSRPVIEDMLTTGVTAIDMFITCGKGQRLGIFAGPGMGKTTLMGMIMRNTAADVVVVALVGERGREINEFIEIECSPEVYSKLILVVATSDRPPIEQIKCPFVAQTIAEYFRNQGKDVLMLVDSITRFARAQREVGFAAGEPVARGGFPPSAFLMLPKLMERAGTNASGSITAFYTVLMEGEELSNDPIADEVKSIVDGHIVLSKELASQGHFPAINLTASLSRIADRLISKEHSDKARHLAMLLAKYKELEFLIRIGEYKGGNDEVADEAVAKQNYIMQFVKQNPRVVGDFNKNLNTLLRF